jgi:two-component system, cell cycle sensor histidine kinase and response regulator CckA
MAGKLLTRMGYETVTARDGAEAIALYEEALSSERPFDVVILDLVMKYGMGGKETFKRLYSIDPNIKAVISSGYTDDPVISNYTDYGFKAGITKPYRVDELREVLRRIISNLAEGRDGE